MIWADFVVLLALLQFMYFSILVARARGTYGVSAPATVGHDMFERYYRVQMNSLELLIMFLPVLYLSSTYWSPQISAALGALYLLGRLIYLRAYVRDPKSRSLGYALSILPIVVMIIASAIGMVRSVLG